MKATMKHAGELKNKRILAATKYYTPEEIVEIFSRVSGKKAVYIQVSNEQFMATLPSNVAPEHLDNQLFIEDPGYYLGEPLEPSLKLLDSKPVTFEDFVRKNLSAWK